MFIQAALVFVQIVLHSTSQKKARKMNEVRHLSTAILLQFPFHMFGFCAYQTLNEYLDNKETDPDVQFADNYPDQDSKLTFWSTCP